MSEPSPVRSARWLRRKDARPAEIAAAGLACFAERGFAATRLDDVAKRAGVTKGTLYLYFASKEELFKAIVREALVANIVRSEAMVDEAGEPAPVLLERLLSQWSELMNTPASTLPKIIIAEAGNFPDLARFYLDEVVHRGLGLFKRLLRIGVERGEFRPMDIESTAFCVAAPLVLSMVWRHSFEPHESRPLNRQALLRTHLLLLLGGLLPEESRDEVAAMVSSAAANDPPQYRKKRVDR